MRTSKDCVFSIDRTMTQGYFSVVERNNTVKGCQAIYDKPINFFSFTITRLYRG